MISIAGLHKRFGTAWVLRGLDLQAQAGELVALCGPNGAGKTTLLRILATLSQPSAGTTSVYGYRLPQDAAHVRRIVGFLGHQPMLYGDLSAVENLHFFARLHGIGRPRERIDQLLDTIGLTARRHERVRTFSRGMQQRLSITRALLADPPVLLLDEPETGLDPDGVDRLRDIVAGAARAGRTILMCTHNLARALAAADRVLILTAGRIAFEASGRSISLADLERKYLELTHTHARAGAAGRLAA